MINFSKIPERSLIGKVLRIILRIIPNDISVFILQGPLKGKKWIKGSGVNGYWLGTYELEAQKFFEKIIKEGDIVYDIGAHVGFYSLLASNKVGSNGKIFSFEPLPRNIVYLRKHIDINNIKNIDVIEAAVFDKEGVVFMDDKINSFYAKISDNGDLKIRTVMLDNLVSSEKLLPPNVIKIDVEGAELSVLKGADFILNKYNPTIFLSMHILNDKIHKNCCNFLRDRGYNLKSITGNSLEGVSEIFAYKK